MLAQALTVVLVFMPSTGGEKLVTDQESFGRPWACPYSTDTPRCKREIAEELTAIFEPFAIEFLTDAPTNRPYRRVLFTNDSTESWNLPPMLLGLTADRSCDGKKEYPSVVFSCTSSEHCARVAAHEVGHMLGLAHVTSRSDIMFFSDSGTPVFRNETLVVTGDPYRCRRRQNSYRLLLQRLGPRERSCVLATNEKKRRRR